MDLIVTNALRTYPGCKVILSHAGGMLPYLIIRPAGMLFFLSQIFQTALLRCRVILGMAVCSF